MRTLLLMLAILTFTLPALGQQQFTGKWETKISPTTGKPSITLNIFDCDGKLSGSLLLVNPDGTQVELQLREVETTATDLNFKTDDHGNRFAWQLRLKKSQRNAILRGNDSRTAKEGGGGEMAIIERLWKKDRPS